MNVNTDSCSSDEKHVQERPVSFFGESSRRAKKQGHQHTTTPKLNRQFVFIPAADTTSTQEHNASHGMNHITVEK